MAEKIKIKLQGHEKFALREGWLHKGLVLVKADAMVFHGKNGPDDFGIGSNMVKSLRYWMKAFGLISEKPGKGAMLTMLGESILENDPYFEDDFTLWLLHSNIAKNLEEATSWYMFFNRCEIEELEKEQIEGVLIREISKYAIGTSFSDKSAKADLDVLLNMYGKTKKATDPEDKNVSSFASLGLVKNFEGKYSKTNPDQNTISEWNVLYELAFMLERKETLSIDEVIYGETGISKIYQINSIVANELLDRLASLGYITVNRTAGLDVIYKVEGKSFTPESVIKDYYNKEKRLWK